jgi:hypothetical protein
MTDPIGFNPFQYQYLYQPEGTAAVNPLTKDINQQQPASISDGGTIRNKSKSGEALQGEKYKDCKTWKGRKYQDGSNDPGVSFKSATHVSPQSAALSVSAHESQHVQHEQTKAMREGKEVVFQSVQISTGICPECGRVYVSGGKTTTVTVDQTDQKTAQKLSQKPEPGQILDTLA